MSKKLLATMVVALVLMLGGTASAGLVNYWSFDGDLTDTAPTAYASINTGASQTDMQEDAWSTNHLSWVTGPVAGAQAVQTVGAGYATTDAKTLDSLDGTADVGLAQNSTVSFWLKVVAGSGPLSGLSEFFYDGNRSGTVHLQYYTNYSSTSPSLNLHTVYAGDSDPSTTGVNFWGEWHFLTVTYNDATNTSTSYVDGVARGTGVYNEPNGTPTHKWLALGCPTSIYNGTNAYARMSTWDNAMSASEVAELYARGGLPLAGSNPIAEPAGLGLIGVALLALRKRRS